MGRVGGRDRGRFAEGGTGVERGQAGKGEERMKEQVGGGLERQVRGDACVSSSASSRSQLHPVPSAPPPFTHPPPTHTRLTPDTLPPWLPGAPLPRHPHPPPPPHLPSYPPPPHISSCPQARNGVCDEGRSLAPSATANEGREAQVKCDLGTDCDDCGTWETKDEVTW